MPSPRININKLKKTKDDLNKKLKSLNKQLGTDTTNALIAFNDEIFDALRNLHENKVEVLR